LGIIEGDYMSKEMKDMEFEELLKWAQEVNWDDVTNEQWKTYESRCEQLAPKYFRNMSISQHDAFYAKYAGDGIDPWFSAWSNSLMDCFPFSTIFDSLRAIEKSVKVLLKENENTPANITIGQLNRLKGGL